MLYACYDLVEKDEDFRVMLMKIKDRYDTIINGLNLKLSLEEEFKKISENFKNKAGVDYAASRGEYLNGIIMANYLGYEFVDAAEVIFLMRMATLCRRKQTKYCLSVLQKQSVRSFRDFTAQKRMEPSKHFRVEVLISRDLSFRGQCGQLCYENWTDVSGFLIADPRIIDNPKPIKTITYRELRELSYMGAGVLHEDAVFPCAKLVYRSISVIRMHRKMREHGSWRAPAISQNIRSPVSQVKRFRFCKH